jgi:hypothetical protein
MAGIGGAGGVGGATECEDVEQLWCMVGDLDGGCINGVCRVFGCGESEDGTLCIYSFPGDDWHPGVCAASGCEDECSVFEEGDACVGGLLEPGLHETGVCSNGQCETL